MPAGVISGARIRAGVKVLVIGSSGLVGYKTALAAGAVGTHNAFPEGSPCRSAKLDLRDAAAVKKILSDESPDAVVNTAALHNVDYCESHPGEAEILNAGAAGALAGACSDAGARLVHVSTDYVFDGSKKEPYSESDEPAPLNAYGATKARGEREVLARGHSVVRTGVVYGLSPSVMREPGPGRHLGFVPWVLQSLRGGARLRIVEDQFVTPTLADSLAGALLAVARSGGGLYHAAGASCESRYSLAAKAAEAFGYDPAALSPVKSSALRQLARRPPYACLDSSRIASEMGVVLPGASEGLREMRAQADAAYPGVWSAR